MYRIVLDNGVEQTILESGFSSEGAALIRCNILRIMSDIDLDIFVETYVMESLC